MAWRACIVLYCVVTMAACSHGNGGKRVAVGDYTMWVQTIPSPLQVGHDAAVAVTLKDGYNHAVPGCRIRFRQFMPGMGMSSDNTYIDLEEGARKGVYRARSGAFSMGGDWTLEFVLRCGDEHHVQRLAYHLEWPE